MAALPYPYDVTINDDSNKPRTVPSLASTYDAIIDTFIDGYITDSDDRYESWDEIIPHLEKIRKGITDQISLLEYACKHAEKPREYQDALSNALAIENRLSMIIKIANHEQITPGDKEYFIQTIWTLRGR